MLGNKGSKKHYRTGGTRGGLDQFKWDDVKLDKHRENYLGHSLSAPVGRWQKGRDLNWYSKSSSSTTLSAREIEARNELEEEKRRLREQDDDLINQAIGIKPKKRKFVENQIDENELKNILAKGNLERDQLDIERVKGIGGAPVKVHEHIERVSSVSKEIMKLQKHLQPNNSSNANDNTSLSSFNIMSSSSTAGNVIPLKTKLDIVESKENDNMDSLSSRVYDQNNTSSVGKDHKHHKHKKDKKEKKEKKDKRDKKHKHSD